MAKHRLRGPLAGLLTVLTAVAVPLAGCGTDSGGSSGGVRPDPDLGGLHRSRGQGLRAPGRRVRGAAPGPEGERLVRQQRRHAAEGADRGARRQPAGHRLPLRVVGAERRPDPAGREPHAGGQAARRGLERLLDRRARRGHRQRQGDRHPGAGGQPGRGLQQDAVRQGRPAAAGPGLDLAAVPGRREEADRPGDQAVRHRVRHPGHRGHGVALGGAALGGRRRAAVRGRQEGGVRLGRRAELR